MNITRRTAVLGGLAMPLLALAGKGISRTEAAEKLPNPLIVTISGLDATAKPARLAGIDGLAGLDPDLVAIRIIEHDAFRHRHRRSMIAPDDVERRPEIDDPRRARLYDKGVAFAVDDMEHGLAAREPGKTRAIPVEFALTVSVVTRYSDAD